MSRLFGASGEPDYYELAPARRDELITKIAHAVVERRLTAPAIFFLESTKPLSFVGSQVMVFFDPLVRALFDLKSYDDIRLALEDRENVERLLRAIEDYDASWRAELKAARKRKD